MYSEEARRQLGVADERLVRDRDCFTYGLAIATGHPVLSVGEGFRHTDAAEAVLPAT